MSIETQTRIFNNVTEMVGNTPLVRLNRIVGDAQRPSSPSWNIRTPRTA
jgi:hypothetical protein